jgi:hypothetical protein
VNITDDAARPLLQGPKRHHFLPQFYLEGFARDGLVALFDREKNEIRLQQPLNTAVIGHFYTLKDGKGAIDSSLRICCRNMRAKRNP